MNREDHGSHTEADAGSWAGAHAEPDAGLLPSDLGFESFHDNLGWFCEHYADGCTAQFATRESVAYLDHLRDAHTTAVPIQRAGGTA